ncbi:two component, sigma54 specific, transcriptional regulator, Fis family [Emticicia oligotrophica DSM 17448]|uniref:Two component, sigma54 specific, transcriptional regulator, Fis family n=1 Tax=Emticicia oligotrophica (strain DSM 17448 / CIP 109782 / MTCC 6937 / GPTSA100-15) TaxID=929562 RepID=A0ABM5MYR8_EMTOG|nr:sigma-54 dependent transcriptional regulator [Emticicia oligotrophica]AFK02316.1 two component, sigma54 specific, transcriptional regulator, Fis family [Emticicia oligotrophica DSM 17448]
MAQRILIIDDDTDICLLLRRFLSKNGYDVAIAHDGTSGLGTLETFTPDLVLTDFRLGDMDGATILLKIKEKLPHVPVLIITGYSDIKIAINVMKQGAYDYITKPLFPDEILLTIKKALSQPVHYVHIAESAASSVESPTKTKKEKKGDYIFGEGPESMHLYKQVDLVAPTNYSVLIYGESGSGKEAIALEIHKRSKRASGPFVAMDCGAISKDLAASELFGHEKGAFTGALNQKIGHFEMADGGTLFLDEVGNLPYDIQVSLLRVVQERKVRRLGGNKEMAVDVRLIVASNERLIEAARKGKFREDLYYRFNEFSIDVPPIRERKEDLLNFAQFFLEKTNEELGKNVKGFSQEVMKAFQQYPWPGNLREMRNVIRRATLLSESDIIEISTLPFELINHNRLLFDESQLTNSSAPMQEQPRYQTPVQPVVSVPNKQSLPTKIDLKSTALDAEYEIILTVLKQVKFNKTKAAEVLGIDRKTLYNKMKQINLNN